MAIRNYFPLLTRTIVLSNKKEISENIQLFFLKHFPKKRYLADPVYAIIIIFCL